MFWDMEKSRDLKNVARYKEMTPTVNSDNEKSVPVHIDSSLQKSTPTFDSDRRL